MRRSRAQKKDYCTAYYKLLSYASLAAGKERQRPKRRGAKAKVDTANRPQNEDSWPDVLILIDLNN